MMRNIATVNKTAKTGNIQITNFVFRYYYKREFFPQVRYLAYLSVQVQIREETRVEVEMQKI